MKRRCFLATCLTLAGCGTPLPEPPPEEEELDPYRAPMANRINAVIYSKRSREQMVGDLALLGVRIGIAFDDFVHESGIDDWFGEESDFLPTRRTSLTCGLSPVVDPAGKIIALYRSRKRIAGTMHGEMVIVPEP